MDATLSPTVQMQYLRPRQLEAALRAMPVVYVPLGLIEWHGQHLPLGTDALKAHAILVKAAELGGGVVYPPLYFPHARYVAGTSALHHAEPAWKLAMMTALFQGLKGLGARVIMGVSGHNVEQQITLVEQALAPVTADGTLAGCGLWEMSLGRGPEVDSDHAAKWESSDMLHFYPQTVSLAELGDGPLKPNMQAPDGIGGLDPRQHATAAVGARKAELAAAAIAAKARELLASLPAEHQAYRLPALVPPHWWLV